MTTDALQTDPRVRECSCDACARSPRSFWFVDVPGQTITTTSFPQAVRIADAHTKLGAPS